jgi:gag-polypeptide of LTR copia-type
MDAAQVQQLIASALAQAVGSRDAFRPPALKLPSLMALSRTNFRPWRTQLVNQLNLNGLRGTWDREFAPAATPEQHASAIGLVIGSLSETDMGYIDPETDLLWDVLDKLRMSRHGRPEQYRVSLARQLLTKQLLPDQDITEFVEEMKNLQQQLQEAGVEFSDMLLGVQIIARAEVDVRYRQQCQAFVGLSTNITPDYVMSTLKAVQAIEEPGTVLHASGAAPRARQMPRSQPIRHRHMRLLESA